MGEVARLKFVTVDAGIRVGRGIVRIIVNSKVHMMLIYVCKYDCLILCSTKYTPLSVVQS